MITKFLQVPIFIKKVNNHLDLKKQVLEDIESMGTHSLIEPFNDQCISNTDWHINYNIRKPYVNTLQTLIWETIGDLKELSKIQKDIKISNYWFQQYLPGDYHGYHNHINSFYNIVYYVELPENGAKTTFNVLGEECEFEVEEGDIICFPGSVMHCSKPNKSNQRKTVVVFNTVNDS